MRLPEAHLKTKTSKRMRTYSITLVALAAEADGTVTVQTLSLKQDVSLADLNVRLPRLVSISCNDFEADFFLRVES